MSPRGKSSFPGLGIGDWGLGVESERAAADRVESPPRPAGRTRLAGMVTVNGAVAREISTACFRNTRSNSACAPGRRSSAGSTYAAGPSTRAFVTERLLF
jgi:hypothetical protein